LILVYKSKGIEIAGNFRVHIFKEPGGQTF
jgi:hypothetical protein